MQWLNKHYFMWTQCGLQCYHVRHEIGIAGICSSIFRVEDTKCEDKWYIYREEPWKCANQQKLLALRSDNYTEDVWGEWK